MLTQIVIHLLPQELDWFEWQSRQLKLSSQFLEQDDEVIIDVTLNLNLVDWTRSDLPTDFFKEKFRSLENLYDWCTVDFTISTQNECLGCDDKRRSSIRNTKADNILYLDTDIIFKPETLKYILEASKAIPEEYYIISPEVYKLWDSSWDALVNKNYRSLEPSQNYKEIDPFTVINVEDEISIDPIPEFKFGGGWFNLISTRLLKLTDIPDSFGPYGVDDTYVMFCANILKQKGYKAQQYVLRGQIVAENIKYRTEPYTGHLTTYNKQSEFRSAAENNFNTEIQNFINRI